MTQRDFEVKKTFVRQTWSRSVCAIFPGVVRVDVTGLALHETAQAILAALGREAA